MSADDETPRIAIRIVLICLLLALALPAYALDPSLDISQYAHTAWKIRDGFPKGAILSIAQTQDGYLWLATEVGLFRFDGVRSVSFEVATNQQLPSNRINGLLTGRDGTLWIATLKGLSSWKNGRLTDYAGLSGQSVGALLEDREGVIWASARQPNLGRLCAVQHDDVRCYGVESGLMKEGVSGLYEDSKGNLWVGVLNGFWRWKPGPPQYYSLPGEPYAVLAFAETDDGTLLIGARDGIRQLVQGKITEYRLPGDTLEFQTRSLLRDRDGALWIGTLNGLVHVHGAKKDVLVQADGLSGSSVGTAFQDREGNIWVRTAGGLDRFREFAVPIISTKQGLSAESVLSVLAARDGSIWLGTFDGLNRWTNGQLTIYRKRRARTLTPSTQPPGIREVIDDGLGDNNIDSLFQDDRGRIWVTTIGGVSYFEDGRFVPVRSVSGTTFQHIAEERAGSLWITEQNQGLFHLLDGNLVEQIPWASLGHQGTASALVVDRTRGALWFGFNQGGIALVDRGQIREAYTLANGLGAGRVFHLQLGSDGTLWASTEGGLSRLRNGRVETLTTRNGLPCDTVRWAVEDVARSFWINTACGLIRIERSELDARFANSGESKQTIQDTIFDNSDGVESRTLGGGYTPQVAMSRDGRIWFAASEGVGVIDPRRLSLNTVPPPVQIEQIKANRTPYHIPSGGGNLSLPARIRDLQIDYTALSLAAPEKMRFRYKLEGHDSDWQDAETRRQAFYTDLPPRNYRFRVMASNNSGVWNEAGAALDFSVAPAYYQTIWFRVAVVAAFAALLAALYQLRLRQVKHQFNVRVDERVAERTRIARDLHDTLLQSFQGVLMKFHAMTFMLDDRPEAQTVMEGVIDQARAAITEGRDAVQGLRSSTLVTNDLAPAIKTLGEQLVGTQACDFQVKIEGEPRNLVPLLRDEIYRIASEALRNAFRHSKAKQIEVEIRYEDRAFRMRIRDDGKGIEPNLIAGTGREGHYGLPGMRERAKLTGGKLAVLSEIGSGTEIELTIPASFAYAKVPAARSAGAGH
jgi:signal transduction histidine kinase/ligand-binding sensor domain-containing protein